MNGPGRDLNSVDNNKNLIEFIKTDTNEKNKRGNYVMHIARIISTERVKLGKKMTSIKTKITANKFSIVKQTHKSWSRFLSNPKTFEWKPRKGVETMTWLGWLAYSDLDVIYILCRCINNLPINEN